LKNIATALVKAQRQFSPALKCSTNPHFRSKYADLAACLEAVQDPLNDNGIALLQVTHDDATGVTVETLFIHESGEQISGGKLHVPASKQDPQGYGSALTYARRYSLLAACGIAPEDDDGNAASKPKNVIPATPSAKDLDIAPARLKVIDLVVNATVDLFNADDIVGAYGEAIGIEDGDEKTALWKLLPSNIRSALKKHGESLKQQKAE
jgi:hypothetical protein